MSDLIQTIDSDQWEDVVLKATGPVVVDFFSTECPPCEALAPKYHGLADIYGRDLTFIKVFRQGNRELAQDLGVSSSPTVLFFDGGVEVGERLTGAIKRSALHEAIKERIPAERVAALAGLQEETHTECDVLIVGAGPAGLTAGIYSAQARLKTIMVDQALAGGNMNITHTISNFPGFPEPQPGWQLAHNMRQHALNAGAELREAVEVTSIDLQAHTVVLDGLETIHARKIVLATGSSPRVIGVKGEVENRGRGISYCATCDAKYTVGKHVVVIGGGNSAIEEALFIARFADRITIVHQFDHLQANKLAQEKAFANEKISFLFEHEPREFVRIGDTVGNVVIEDLRTGERRDLPCDVVFVFAGMTPNLQLLSGELELDDWGWVRTDPQMHTNHEGVFAIGDLASKRFRQMTTAVADGTIAAMTLVAELQAEPA